MLLVIGKGCIMSGSVILVGCGNMGYAMLGGWLAAGRLSAGDVTVVEPADDLRHRAAELGVKTVAGPQDLAADAAPALVVIAVKPQLIADILPSYVRHAQGGATFLSIAAGVGMAAFARILGDGVPVIRCMPNTPAAIGLGMMVVVDNGAVPQPTLDFVRGLLAASGEVATIEREDLMDAVTAVSGSGPAYLFHFVECLTEAGEKAGLPPQTASRLATQTVFGAASLAAGSKHDPATLRRQVTSPNGTTAAALDVLMGEDRLKKLVAEAVEAARLRSIELGR